MPVLACCFYQAERDRHAYTHMHAHTHTHAHIHAHMHTHACTHIPAHMRTHIPALYQAEGQEAEAATVRARVTALDSDGRWRTLHRADKKIWLAGMKQLEALEKCVVSDGPPSALAALLELITMQVVHVSMRTCMRIHMHAYTHACVCVYVYTCDGGAAGADHDAGGAACGSDDACMHAHTYMHACMHTRHAYAACIHTHAYAYTHMHTHTCIRIHTHAGGSASRPDDAC